MRLRTLVSLVTLPALLPLLLALASAHGMRPLGAKTIYERGDSRWPFNWHRNFRMLDGQCTGVVEGSNLPCRLASLYPPMRLRVTAQHDPAPPRVVISERLDYANVTRSKPCRGELRVLVDGGCGLRR